MTTEDFIIELFIRIDATMKGIRKQSQANLYPSEVVTLGILFSLKGVGNRDMFEFYLEPLLKLLKTDLWPINFELRSDRTIFFR